MRWVHWIFAVLTLGPLVVWGLAIAGTMILGFWFGCRIDEGGSHPCDVWGRDVGDAAVIMGLYAAWGPLIVGPISFGFGFLWAIFTIACRILRKRRS